MLTREETARRLNVATVTLDGWTRCGRGPVPTRRGRRVYYSEEAVARYEAERDRTPTPAEVRTCFADIVYNELAERVARVSPMLAAAELKAVLGVTAKLGASLWTFDKRINAGNVTEADARQFIAAAESLLTGLELLGGAPTVGGSLAEAIAIVALLTARERFAHLLPDDLR